MRDALAAVRIRQLVASEYGISEDILLSPRRDKKYSHPRHVAMYLAREVRGATFAAIGRHYGGRDHTTVLHGVKTIQNLINSDESVRKRVTELRAKLVGENADINASSEVAEGA